MPDTGDDVVYAELERVRENHGRLTPPVLVEDAKAPHHPLHKFFEWDDAVAGPKYRLEQARMLIQSVTIGRLPDQPEVRGYVSIREQAAYHYVPAELVAEDPVRRRIVLQEMEREWKSLRRKYEQYEEFFALVERDVAA